MHLTVTAFDRGCARFKPFQDKDLPTSTTFFQVPCFQDIDASTKGFTISSISHTAGPLLAIRGNRGGAGYNCLSNDSKAVTGGL